MQPPTAGEPPPPPREGAPLVRSFGPSFLLLFGGIWAFVGTTFLVAVTATGAPIWDDLILDRRGVTATVVPTRSEARSRTVNRRVVYAVSYRYRDRAGVPRDGTIEVPGGRTGAFQIEYDPGSPSRVRVKGERASALGAGLLVPTAFALVGWALVARGVRARRRERALYRNGTATPARVRTVEPTGGRINGSPAYRVEFIFPSPGGAVRASSVTLDPPRPNETVWVIYDPAAPDHVMFA